MRAVGFWRELPFGAIHNAEREHIAGPDDTPLSTRFAAYCAGGDPSRPGLSRPYYPEEVLGGALLLEGASLPGRGSRPNQPTLPAPYFCMLKVHLFLPVLTPPSSSSSTVASTSTV